MTDNDGSQPIAIGHLRYSDDLNMFISYKFSKKDPWVMEIQGHALFQGEIITK